MGYCLSHFWAEDQIVPLQLASSMRILNILELVQPWWVQRNQWDRNVKIIFLILSKGEIVKLVYTQLIPIGVILEVGVMCLRERIPETCNCR